MDDQGAPTAGRPSFWTRRRTLLAAGAVGLVCAISLGAYIAWRAQRNSPEETVAVIASAAMRGDAEGVAASINTTAIADSAVDAVLSDPGARGALVSDYLKTHPALTEAQLKAKLRATLDEEIREHVKSGTLPKRVPMGSESLKALVAAAVARQSVRWVKVDGDVAHVMVAVPYKGKTLNVKVRMQRSGDSWKVDEIENLSEVLKQAGY